MLWSSRAANYTVSAHGRVYQTLVLATTAGNLGGGLSLSTLGSASPNTGRLPTMRQLAPRSPKRVLISNYWRLARPKRFELLTPRFVVCDLTISRENIR